MIHSGDALARLSQLNKIIILLVLLLGLVGLAMMYSAAGGKMEPWARPQMVRFAVAFVAMIVIACTPIQFILRYAYLAYFGCLMMLVVVEGAGFIGMGAQRWVKIGMVNVQPSEMMKVATILAIARYFHGIRTEDIRKLSYLIVPIIMALVPAALILKQPNLGTATILVSVAGIMFFMAGVKLRYFILVAIVGISALPVAWHFMHDYQKKRVMTFLDPQQDPLGAGYNILQSMIAIGSGGLNGKGFLQGSQGQLDFLPEKQTDFIFTMLAEEFGFAGSFAVLAAFAMLILLGILVAMQSRNTFGSLIASGITGMLFMHIFINVGMVMGMLPVVGVPLPLLSYGGTMMVTILIAFGLLLNADVNRNELLSRSMRVIG